MDTGLGALPPMLVVSIVLGGCALVLLGMLGTVVYWVFGYWKKSRKPTPKEDGKNFWQYRTQEDQEDDGREGEAWEDESGPALLQPAGHQPKDNHRNHPHFIIESPNKW